MLTNICLLLAYIALFVVSKVGKAVHGDMHVITEYIMVGIGVRRRSLSLYLQYAFNRKGVIAVSSGAVAIFASLSPPQGHAVPRSWESIGNNGATSWDNWD